MTNLPTPPPRKGDQVEFVNDDGSVRDTGVVASRSRGSYWGMVIDWADNGRISHPDGAYQWDRGIIRPRRK